MKNRFSFFLLLFNICIFNQHIEALPWPIPPQDSAHALNKVYGDWNVTIFHNAVDIQASHGTPVLAVESGIVTSTGRIDTFHYCWVAIKKTDTDTAAWFYFHIVPRMTIAKDSLVNLGDTIGHVCDYEGSGDPNDHIHFQLADTFMLVHSDTSYANPQDSLSPPIPSQTPKIYSGRNLPHHPYQIYYILDHFEDTTTSYEKTYLHDSVDIIVRAGVNALGDTCSGVHALGYGVQPKTTGGNIPFRKMFEMHGNMELSRDSIKHCLTYAGPPDGDTLCTTHWQKYYVVTNCGDSLPQPNYGISNIQENCWPTKINIAGTANADSIEDARFPDGDYVTTIKAWAHSGDSAAALDTVLVDNFNPHVDTSYPTNWYHWIAEEEKEVWCRFSEAMDSATLNATNIKIRSLVDTTYYYTITNISYMDSLHKLILEVDSFRKRDEVGVQLTDSIKDIAGKSLEYGGGKEKGIAYTWKFTVGVIKLTDNDLMDIRPEIYGNKIAWVEVLIPDVSSNIKFHDLSSHITSTLNTTTGRHNWPIVWKNQVVWRQELGSYPYYRDRIYYYNGNSTQLIVPENLCRNQYDFDSCGIVMYSTVRGDGAFPDTIWVQYYEIGSGLSLLDRYTVQDNLSRNIDINDGEIVWEHGKTAKDGGFSPGGFKTGVCSKYEHGYKSDTRNIGMLKGERAVYTKDIYLRGDFGVSNLTSFMDSSINAMPSVSQGQSAWMRYSLNQETLTVAVWVYDGAGSRQLSADFPHSLWIYWPEIQNGDLIWYDYDENTGEQRLHYYDGWQEHLLAQDVDLYYFVFMNWQVENDQAIWLQLGTVNDPVYFDGEQTTKLVQRDSTSYRIGIDKGMVVSDAWDGHDNEIYLYTGDTLKTPPVVVKNLQSDVLSSKSPDKKVKLTWKANVEPDLAGYKIYRSSTPHQYGTVPYVTVLTSDTTFTDTLPLEGMNYYVVTAYDNLNNESGFSNQASVLIDNIPPAVPMNLVANYDSINQKVVIIWRSSPDADLKSYQIYRSEISGNYTTPIDSVFKPDTAFIDSTIYLGKSYYYVVSAVDTNKNESGFSNEDTVIVPFFVASDFALATAYNNGRKIVSSPAGDEVYYVYSTGGGIYYCYSSDSGKSFSAGKYLGTGQFPALALDRAGLPHVAWVRMEEDLGWQRTTLWYGGYTGTSWLTPVALDTLIGGWEHSISCYSQPSMIVDANDTVRIVWESSESWCAPGGQPHKSQWQVNYGQCLKTDLNTWGKIFLDTVVVTGPPPWGQPESPSTACDDSGNVHCVWSRPVEDEIYYSQRTASGWSTAVNLSDSPDSVSKQPFIEFYGDRINLVWQEERSEEVDIYYRSKVLSGGWDTIMNISNNTGKSRYPVISAGHYCLWQDSSTANWEIYMSEYIDTLGSWSLPDSVSHTAMASAYPHCAYSLIDSAVASLYCLWTEGDTIPYTIKFRKLDVLPVAKIYADLGQPIQSPYCLARDGYWVFGDKPYETVDWGYEHLSYKFSGLDPEKEYRMDLAYYFENTRMGADDDTKERGVTCPSPLPSPSRGEGISEVHGTAVPENMNEPDRLNGPEGIGRIIQTLVVDGMALDTAFITPNKLIRISVWLKKESYADEEIISEIQKVKGKRVVCAEIGLFEFPKGKKEKIISGTMGKESAINQPFVWERIYPNPVKNLLKIRFNAPDNRKITIKLYDVSGRLVQKEDFLCTKIGENEVSFAPKGLSCGIYFVRLETDNYQKIEKVIFLK